MRLYNPHLKGAARQLRTNMTPSEKILWDIVRCKQLLNVQFYRQKIVDSYILDFYAPAVNLVIELDGEYHLQKEIIEQDNFRDKYLQTLNLHTLRFSNHQVLNNTDDVIHTIINFIKKQKRLVDVSDSEHQQTLPTFSKGGHRLCLWGDFPPP